MKKLFFSSCFQSNTLLSWVIISLGAAQAGLTAQKNRARTAADIISLWPAGFLWFNLI